MWDNVTVLEEYISGTPMCTPSSWYTLGNSGTLWVVRYTRLTSIALEYYSKSTNAKTDALTNRLRVGVTKLLTRKFSTYGPWPSSGP